MAFSLLPAYYLSMPSDYQVLIVEDDSEQSELVTEFLTIAGNFRVETAGDLHEMWSSLQSKMFDILLLDYRLPDGSGLEALSQIAMQGIEIPVVMVSGQGDERVAAQAIQLGAVDYLVKNGEHLLTLPALIQKTVRAHQLQLSVKRSLEQVRYQALLLNNVRDAVVVWDSEGQITYWNPAAEILFGRPHSELVGMNVYEHYLNSFTPPVRVPPDGGTCGQEVERRYDGNGQGVRWVSSRVSTLRDYGRNSRTIGYMDVCRDITERKDMQAQIHAAQTHLAQSTRLAAIGELASGVAHQINNPLTTIIADAQLLMHTLPAYHPARESAEAIEQAGWRAQRAVQRLLDFSRPASGQLGSVSIDASIQRAVALVGANIQANGVSLQVQMSETLPLIRGNPRQIEDLWVNLLLLSRDATVDGAAHTIRVRTWAEAQDCIAVEIYDDGKPIPPDELDTIFEPNFVESKIGRGSGMELSICREIVRQHQGKISAESVPGHGTIFQVRFPVEVQV